ncbi:MAG: hypothetical protein HY795_15925 [Desulfovibrio sp.]|nr:hypothetical protein [Desulfovibrio sp.]MBI4960885.1 hypothetical protein [Desulfovibrio sp.]
MIALSRILPWAGALALGVLGWFAMVPIWTQGLVLAAPDADSQPALWLAAANVMMVLGGGVILLRAAAAVRGEGGFGPVMRSAQVLGVGLYLAAFVLFVAMIGQPVRVWFLVAHWDWSNTFCQAILGFAVCLSSFFLKPCSGILEFVIAFSGLGAFILLALRLSPNMPVVHGHIVTPSQQDWLVLAFALGCGVYASWLRARGLSK